MITDHIETIAAIATPVGDGGLSVIRVSGQDAINCVDRYFTGAKKLAECSSHTAHYGNLRDEAGAMIDKVVCTLFRAPHSYTGEDVVEVSCHGGMYVTRRILGALLNSGARQAQPGEFTRRGFLNGRMDLSQAEAVADLIRARSEKARAASLRQLEGGLSVAVNAIRERLVNTLGLLELELDFVEDGYEFVEKSGVAGSVRTSLEEIDRLLSTYREGRILNEGMKVVLAGAPNVGKSSLLNALLNENRAIVTDIPGTTRDSIEECVSIEGFLFRLTDTAGLRETENLIEQEGVRRTERHIENSDLVLFVTDSTRRLNADELRVLERFDQLHKDATIVVKNKIDLPADETQSFKLPTVRVSAKTHKGLEDLKKELVRVAAPGSATNESAVLVTSARHYSAFLRTKEGLQAALQSTMQGAGGELVSADLRIALEALSEVVGIVTTEDILNAVFSKFCIGK